MKKNLQFVIFIIFTISASINSYASYEGHEENLGREGPPPAGPYRLGYKELERAIKTEKKGKIKKAKIKYEKALEYFLKANAENPANADIFNYLGISVGCLTNDTEGREKRKEQYACDITYGTNNEFGFDYLRDNLSLIHI